MHGHHFIYQYNKCNIFIKEGTTHLLSVKLRNRIINVRKHPLNPHLDNPNFAMSHMCNARNRRVLS